MPVALHFVHTSLSRGKTERSRSDRSHAARIGRQKRKRSSKEVEPAWPQKRLHSRDGQSPTRRNLDTPGKDLELVEPALVGLDIEAASDVLTREPESDHDSFVERSLLSSGETAIQRNLPRTIAPVFGALAIASFDLEQSVSAADIGRYIFERALSISVAPRERSDWFAAWCQQPLVYHTLCYAGLFMRRGSDEQKMTRHHIKIVQLANRMLESTDILGKSRLAGLIMAVTTLWGINLDSKSHEWHICDERSLYKKRMPEDFMVYATSRNHHDDLHVPALIYLVNKVGGLHAMPFLPGMGSSIAFSDLVEATTMVQKPRFPSYWETQPPGMQEAVNVVSPPPVNDDFGAFANVPGCLPPSFLATLSWLRCFNQQLSTTTHRTEEAAYVVYQIRNAIQHRILALPTWSESHKLGATRGSNRAVYEVCRLTTLLYATEICMGIGRRDLWQAKILQQLLDVLETANLLMWRDRKASELLVWSLMVGSIAAWWTSHRNDFCQALMQAVEVVKLETLEETEYLLEKYLWMHVGCGSGAAVIWESLRNLAAPESIT